MKIKYKKNFLKTLFPILIVPFLLIGCKKNVVSEPYTDYGYLSFKGDGTFAQMTPVPTTPSTGNATFTARWDNNSRILNYTLSWFNLSSVVTKADLYFPSTLTQNGVLVRNVFTGQSYGLSSNYAGYIWGLSGLSDSELEAMKTGKVYYVIISSANTSGEIRGQVSIK